MTNVWNICFQDKTPDEFKVRANIHEALLLKLSLVSQEAPCHYENRQNTVKVLYLACKIFGRL